MSAPWPNEVRLDLQRSNPERLNRYVTRIETFLVEARIRASYPQLLSYLKGFTLGLVIGKSLVLQDGDEIKRRFPSVANASDEDVPFGPIVHTGDDRHPDVSALHDQVRFDAFRTTWIGLKNAIHRAATQGGNLSDAETFVWLGYLQASRETNEFSGAQRQQLFALLPKVEDPLTPLMQRLAATDGAAKA